MILEDDVSEELSQSKQIKNKKNQNTKNKYLGPSIGKSPFLIMTFLWIELLPPHPKFKLLKPESPLGQDLDMGPLRGN